MKEIKNVSVKMVGIPAAEGGNHGLLPDERVVVDDKLAAQPGVKAYLEAGFIEVRNVGGKAPAKLPEQDAPAADEDSDGEDKKPEEPAAAKKPRKAAK